MSWMKLFSVLDESVFGRKWFWTKVFLDEFFAHLDENVPNRLPMLLAGDAYVWHPHFNVGRQHLVDDLIVPLVFAVWSCCAGAALDLVMMFSSCSGSVRVHDGMGCCNHAPGCQRVFSGVEGC